MSMENLSYKQLDNDFVFGKGSDFKNKSYHDLKGILANKYVKKVPHKYTFDV